MFDVLMFCDVLMLFVLNDLLMDVLMFDDLMIDG